MYAFLWFIIFYEVIILMIYMHKIYKNSVLIYISDKKISLMYN